MEEFVLWEKIHNVCNDLPRLHTDVINIWNELQESYMN